VSEARRLKALEDENARPKKLLAEAMVDNAMLRMWPPENSDARRQTRCREAHLKTRSILSLDAIFKMLARSSEMQSYLTFLTITFVLSRIVRT
jgi:hypothetical protein